MGKTRANHTAVTITDFCFLLLRDYLRGLGKTRQVLVTLFALMECKKVKKALITCPPTLISNWLEEIGEIRPFFPSLRSLALVSSLDFSSAHRRREAIRAARNEAKRNPVLVVTSFYLLGEAEKLRQWKWQFLAVDEVRLTIMLDEKV